MGEVVNSPARKAFVRNKAPRATLKATASRKIQLGDASPPPPQPSHWVVVTSYWACKKLDGHLANSQATGDFLSINRTAPTRWLNGEASVHKRASLVCGCTAWSKCAYESKRVSSVRRGAFFANEQKAACELPPTRPTSAGNWLFSLT